MITINGYAIDATISESHSFDSEVTQYPVEKGSDITDNVRPKPITVTLEGVVSDTPIGNMVAIREKDTFNPVTGNLLRNVGLLPSNDALARLLGIRNRREPVVIESSLQRFEDMVMTSLSVPRSPQTGKALRFSATFQQIVFVTNNRTTVRVATPQAEKKVKLGLLQPGKSFVNRFEVDPNRLIWFDGIANSWRASAYSSRGTGKWFLSRGRLTKQRPGPNDILVVVATLAE